MEFMELPLEILHIVLFYAALGRGIKRTLRLRLICKTFASAIYPALFETHLMDELDWPHVGFGSEQWQRWNQHGADKLWHKYLLYRFEAERDTTLGCFIHIRQIAQAICQEKGSATDLHATVDTLFWLALTHGTRVGCDIRSWWCPPLNAPERRATWGRNALLSAAAHFNLFPLAKRLIAEGHSPTSHNYLFAPPIQVAAQAGNVNMLRLFQEKLPKSTLEPFSVTGAAIRGDLEIVKLALRLPQKTGQSAGGSDAAYNPQLSSIEWTSKPGALILGLRRYASKPKVYDYLTSVLVPWPTSLEKSHEDLIMYAMFGNMLMVRHLLHLGVPVHVSGYIKGPLEIACRYGHNDIVDLLLEQGANPNYVGQIFCPSFPLHDPATASNLSLACKLLDHGALPNRPGGRPGEGLPALWWAFAREHTKMIHLLLQRGASLDGGPDDKSSKGWVGKSLAEMTCSLGYYSMVEILRQYGVEITNPPAYRAGNYQFWHKWADARALLLTLK